MESLPFRSYIIVWRPRHKNISDTDSLPECMYNMFLVQYPYSISTKEHHVHSSVGFWFGLEAEHPLFNIILVISQSGAHIYVSTQMDINHWLGISQCYYHHICTSLCPETSSIFSESFEDIPPLTNVNMYYTVNRF